MRKLKLLFINKIYIFLSTGFPLLFVFTQINNVAFFPLFPIHYYNNKNIYMKIDLLTVNIQDNYLLLIMPCL
jgi:hypothetical protein